MKALTETRAAQTSGMSVLTVPLPRPMKKAMKDICSKTGIHSLSGLARVFFVAGMSCWQARGRLPSPQDFAENGGEK